jgi:hypothetical protein
MSTLPSEKWRLSEWLKIDHAARLIVNIDPNANGDDLTDRERDEVEACRSSIWETAKSSEENPGVKIEYALSFIDNKECPSEHDSRVSVEWVKNLLSSKGVTSGFFFPSTTQSSEAFMDPTHEHFSPELALAVTVWREFESKSVTKKTPKRAMMDWNLAVSDAMMKSHIMANSHPPPSA